MEDRLDVVAVGIERESRVVARVVGALAGPAVVAAAMGERRRMKRLNALPVPRLEGEVDPDTGPSARSTQSSSLEKCSGLSEVRSRPTARRTAR